MERNLSQHTEVCVFWCCKVKSGCLVLFTSSAASEASSLYRFSKTLECVELVTQQMQRHFKKQTCNYTK